MLQQVVLSIHGQNNVLEIQVLISVQTKSAFIIANNYLQTKSFPEPFDILTLFLHKWKKSDISSFQFFPKKR